MNLTDLLTQIAREHLNIETLETRKSDHLDFHDVSVWQIEAALRAAYDAGRESMRRKSPKRTPPTKP